MKTTRSMSTTRKVCLSALLPGLLAMGLNFTAVGVEAARRKAPPSQANAPIPWDQVGAKAGADYHGDGLRVSATPEGARLHCVFQRLDGEATPEGLWLTSTTDTSEDERFRVVARGGGARHVVRAGPAAKLRQERHGY